MLPEHDQTPHAAVDLWRPTFDDPDVRRAVARCLSSAFSSGIWRATPMPIGSACDPASALGVINGLGRHPVAVAASCPDEGDIVGCVIGGLMDAGVIAAYGLAGYGARPGDGLLAFIGIVPAAQGLRLGPGAAGTLRAVATGPSLARHLFESWMASEALGDCTRIFIRTRRQIGPIRHLSTELGFAFRGRFETEFRGQMQSRLVYCRTRDPEGEA